MHLVRNWTRAVKFHARIPLVLIALALSIGSASATDEHSYLITPARLLIDPAAPMTAEFTHWVDPLRYNWMAWSPVANALEENDTTLIPSPPTAGGKCIILRLTAPDGRVSAPYHFDAFHPSIIYGAAQHSPWISRVSAGGTELLNEGGLANEFFHNGGAGFYRFDVTIECPAEVAGAIEPPLYLLMNVYDGYQVERPTENRFRGAIGMLGSGGDNGGSDNDSDPDDTRVVGPGLPEIPDDFRFPDHPVYPPSLPEFDEPPIPEPITLALAGVGLGLAALIRRRRR